MLNAKSSLRIRKLVVVSILAIMLTIVTHADEIPQSHGQFTVHTWESGERMFYTDDFWRGGDCASSLDIGNGRVMWLFADSFVGIKSPWIRDTCCVDMIHNCLGIQRGYDPSTAEFNVYWRGTRAAPSAYFPSDDTSWYWPGNAVRIDSCLVVFLMHICSSDSGLGFRVCGGSPQAAFIVRNFDGNPLEWTIARLQLPENRFGIMLGAATILEPPYLYMFGVKEPGDHSMYLARWHTDSLLDRAASAVEWWTGDSSTWVSDPEVNSPPWVVFANGATELSVIRAPQTDQYFAIQTVGFGAADVMLRIAPELTGPWPELQMLYEPPEKSDSSIMIYAAKAHPEIPGADIIITYNTNGPIEKLVTDSTVYYPRIVKVNWSR